MDDYESYHDYFMSKRSWFLGLRAAAYGLDLLDTLLKGVDHSRSLGIDYPIQAVVVAGLCLLGVRTRSRRYHAALVTVVSASQVYQAVAYLWMVSR